MNRRRFITIALSVSTANIALLRSAEAKENETEGPDFNSVILLALVMGTFAINFFGVFINSVLFGHGTVGAQPYEPAEKLNSSKILGNLGSKPVADEFSGASVIGDLYVLNNMLILIPTVVLTLATVSFFWLTHQNKVWKYRRPRKARGDNLPTEEEVKAAQKVGFAVQKGNKVLGVVGPSKVKAG